MVVAKRARTAETPKRPSLDLRSRAPQFYPDWAMVEAKRARTAETPKPPSFDLRSRAPYFYPTVWPQTWRRAMRLSNSFWLLDARTCLISLQDADFFDDAIIGYPPENTTRRYGNGVSPLT